MNSLGLSPEALEARRKYVQAGDAARLMAGEWSAVWREKMGQAKGDDLSSILAVQMGSFTEPFNLAWCEKQTGRHVEYYSDHVVHQNTWRLLMMRTARTPELQVSKTYPWMACNLDGMTTTAQGQPCVIDAKHVGRADDPMILRYTAAGTHQATVMGTDWWALSVFIGNSRWELIEQEVDPLYQASLIAAEREFWSFVERGEEPEDRTAPGLPPKPTPKLRSIILPTEQDEVFAALVKQNNWLPGVLPEIRRFVETDGATKVNGIARSRIKDAIPGDLGELDYGLFHLRRDKSGSVRMTVNKPEDDDGDH